MTYPESDRTLALQRVQLIEGRRAAMLYPANCGHIPPGPPPGMDVTFTADGVFHFNPSRTSAEEIQALSSVGFLNEILALGPVCKDEVEQRVKAGDHPIAVVECDQDGHEVKAAWGTLKTAPEQIAAFEASKTPGHFVFVTSPLHVLAARASAQQVSSNGHARH